MQILLEERALLGVQRDIVAPMDEQSNSSSVLAQRAWAITPVRARLRVLRRARHLLAAQTEGLCAAIPVELSRNAADTICAEILPLLSAIKFLEREAEAILRTRHIGTRGRPLWLMGVRSEVHRAPMGQILVIAPSNYPLFLPGVQIVQALAAGNSAIWKPAPGGREIALLFAQIMRQAGLPQGLLKVTKDSIEAAQTEISAGVDKVFFTGSATSGKVLLKQLAETLTPCVAELSGCDAVFVLPSADLSLVEKALAFGMRLNGSATCMAPRRIILVGATASRREELVQSLLTAFKEVQAVKISARTKQSLFEVVQDARAAGAQMHGEWNDFQRPVLLTGVTAGMSVAQADIFAPLLSLIEAVSVEEALAINDACPYALTAAIFAEEREALALASLVTAGTVIVNDLMVPAADPRTPFGGRRSSGFGTTQGAEGLLEMTAPKTISVRNGSNTDHYQATTPLHEKLFKGIIHASHLPLWQDRLAGLKQVFTAANSLRRRN